MNSYLGQTPVFGDFPFEILSGDGTSFYELNFKTNGTNGLLVFLNGAVQRPGIDFTCDGDALTFSANVSVGVQIFVYGMGLPKSSLAPSAGSVGLAELDAEVNEKLNEIDTSITSLPITKEFLSPNNTITTSGQLIIPHGLGVVPKKISMFLRCLVAEHGYSVGDVTQVDWGNYDSGGGQVTSIRYTANDVIIRYSDDSSSFILANATTGSEVSITNVRWEMFFYVWA